MYIHTCVHTHNLPILIFLYACDFLFHNVPFESVSCMSTSPGKAAATLWHFSHKRPHTTSCWLLLGGQAWVPGLLGWVGSTPSTIRDACQGCLVFCNGTKKTLWLELATKARCGISTLAVALAELLSSLCFLSPEAVSSGTHNFRTVISP